MINIVKIHVLVISIFLLHISNMHTHKLEMYTIYDISLHNINISAIIPFEKLEYQAQLCTMDFREPSVPLKGRDPSSVCNGSFLLKERPVGFKGKTGICNHLNFNFLPNQNSVPVTHGIFSNKHDGICRMKRQSIYNKFQQFKIQIPWLQPRLPSSHIWRGICMSGTDKVQNFNRITIRLQGSPSRFTSPTSLPFITSCINYPFLIRKASPGKRQEISLLFFPAQGEGRIRKFIIISVRTASLLSKRKLRWK